MNFFDKLQNVDRRYIYIVVAICIIVPFLKTFHSNTYTTEPVENIYKMIDSFSGRDDRAILLTFQHDASTTAELLPMEIAVLRHCFERNVKVFTLTFIPAAAPLIDYAINTVKEEFPDIQSGRDYCNIGYKPGALYMPIILGMGDDIAEAVETDAEGKKLDNLDIMKGIKNYNELNLVIEFSASGFGYGWITYARSKFGANVAAGITAVMAADAYPFIQSGQLVGIFGGLKGAAEYEKLVDVFASNKLRDDKGNLIVEDKYGKRSSMQKGYVINDNNDVLDKSGTVIMKDVKLIPKPREFSKEIAKSTIVRIDDPNLLYKFKTARIGMNAQNVAHIMIIVFIILGNIGFFIQKRKEQKEQQ